MGAGSSQPLAERKGVHREVKSERSVMSKIPARGTRIALGSRSGMSLPNKTKSNQLHRHEAADVTCIWEESCSHRVSVEQREYTKPSSKCALSLSLGCVPAIPCPTMATGSSCLTDVLSWVIALGGKGSANLAKEPES